jgi:sugar phosphate isomerase/epimerase
LRIAIDSYAFHRLLGEVRPGEREPRATFAAGSLDVVAEALRLGVDGVSLETCFLPPPSRLDAARLRAAAERLELVLAWGHPDGLEFGASRSAYAELCAWLEVAPRIGARLVRVVAASPRLRGAEPLGGRLRRTRRALAAAADVATDLGIALALENHADLTAAEIGELLDPLGDRIGVCFDTANALRVGDDPLEAARALAARVRIVHLKDCEGGQAADRVTGPASVPYGEGVVPVDDVLAVFEAAGFDGLVCVELGHVGPGEVDERAMVEACVAWLRARPARAASPDPA